ncbi:jg7933, partial [Pararge aegeria aegeria]
SLHIAHSHSPRMLRRLIAPGQPPCSYASFTYPSGTCSGSGAATDSQEEAHYRTLVSPNNEKGLNRGPPRWPTVDLWTLDTFENIMENSKEQKLLNIVFPAAATGQRTEAGGSAVGGSRQFLSADNFFVYISHPALEVASRNATHGDGRVAGSALGTARQPAQLRKLSPDAIALIAAPLHRTELYTAGLRGQNSVAGEGCLVHICIARLHRALRASFSAAGGEEACTH